LELKQFFLRDDLEPATIQMMGSAWARAFLEGEATSLTAKLGTAPKRSWRLRDVRARVERAFAQLSARGLRATHVVGPYSWRLWEVLADDRGALHGPRTEGRPIATVLGVPVFESLDDLDSVFVLSLPAAIRVDQRLFDGEVFYVSVSQIDDDRLEALRLQGIDDVEGTATTAEERIKTRVDVDVRESVAFNIKREAIVRVAIPPELLD
jgi:hypothetical protein